MAHELQVIFVLFNAEENNRIFHDCENCVKLNFQCQSTQFLWNTLHSPHSCSICGCFSVPWAEMRGCSQCGPVPHTANLEGDDTIAPCLGGHICKHAVASLLISSDSSLSQSKKRKQWSENVSILRHGSMWIISLSCLSCDLFIIYYGITTSVKGRALCINTTKLSVYFNIPSSQKDYLTNLFRKMMIRIIQLYARKKSGFKETRTEPGI